jgi:hypothetical protein
MVTKKKLANKSPKKSGKARNRILKSGEPTSALVRISQEIETEPDRKIGLKYFVPPELEYQYADNLNVTHTENEFIISFVQLQHPLVATNEEMKAVDTVYGKCVARLIVSPRRMPAFIEAMSKNFNRYMEELKSSMEAEEGAEK